MSRRAWNWITILAVLAVALANPAYRHYGLDEPQPIVTLGLDLKGGVEVLLRAVPETGEPPTQEQLGGAMEIVENRVNPQGQKEIFLAQVGSDRILLQVPGEKNPDAIIEIIGETALLEWVNTGEDSFTAGIDFNLEGSSERKPEFAKYETLLTGADLMRANTSLQFNKPTIVFTFKPEAREIFGRYTTDHVGQYLTVLLDGKVLTSPVIQSPIWSTSGIIEGSFTLEYVNKIVRQLNAGALPVPLTILSASVVGPALGQESIDKSFIAGLIGFAVVLLFMLLFYRLPGVVAAIALSLYVVLVLGFFSLINATLTLPGIAGLLLSIGMAIDGNIIIFERLKEELRWGKTLLAALEAAFARAWVAIVDGNVTTLICAAVLYFLGTGPVKGFAVTLSLGIVLSLFSAVFVTRNILELFVRIFPKVSLYASVPKEPFLPSQILASGRYFRYVERAKFWLTASVLIIIAGAVFMTLNYVQSREKGAGRVSVFNLGIDYTSGDKLILAAIEEFPLDGQDVKRIVEKYSDGEPVVQVDVTDPHIVTIRMRMLAPGQSEDERSRNRAKNVREMKEEIGEAYGGFSSGEGGEEPNPGVREQDFVGPAVGKELIRNAIWALILGCTLIMLYILIRFGRWQMSLAAIVALIHDVLITLGFTAALGLEINASFIAVILTIIGYSINDTIIIFDRVRENVRLHGEDKPLSQLCNLSLNQTLLRSINTVVTVLFMIVALLVLGGSNIRDFLAAMLVGMISGGYSSVFIATPIMLYLSRGKMQMAAEAPAAVGAGAAADVSVPMPEEETMVTRQIAQQYKKREHKKQRKKQRRR